MQTNQEQIIKLILKEINGTAGDHEKAYLYNLIANDDEFYQIYMKMHADLDSEEVKVGMHEMSGTMKSFFLKQIQNRWTLVICIFLIKSCVIGGIILYYKYQYDEKQLELARLKERLTPPSSFTLK